MPENNIPLPLTYVPNKASGQSLRLQWRTFAADIMAVRLQKTRGLTQRCSHYRHAYSLFVTFSTSPD